MSHVLVRLKSYYIRFYARKEKGARKKGYFLVERGILTAKKGV